MKEYSRFAIHSYTNKPWPLATMVERYAKAGVSGISVWKETMEGMKPKDAAALIGAAGLKVVSMVRGGFFPASSADERKRKIQDNIELIRASAELGAPLIVLVCGADPKVGLVQAREQVKAGIEAILPEAERQGVKLAIEPLHPLYADLRSVVNTMEQANDLCQAIAHPGLGVAVDVYHVWWDPKLEEEIGRCGSLGKLFAFHVCDWKTPPEDFLNDRGLMGEGCVDIPLIRTWVEKTGFRGFVEVEIFSKHYWAMDQDVYLGMIKKAWEEKV
ncbi:MAG: sugar phosphate isomerase/epimerase [Spirochaetia bacterium]|mgnify:FL=1|jgi:sugar phosphate isomerase/epimerase|uniref:Xylose isomerase-like TIM barrel domain-containing protein n=1 Tax=bioreactor metagenome TaxID=1076179 RepID=A0A644TVK3_9ZZZZ|nr:sugar phosphate isomerase/epimerase [Spirochaetia bacterium]MCE1207850.1 sugar phosphate isomerase/epimerase [Spirochaetia bacterium]VBB38889.1 Xylose isomerase domain-containing protein TIM barrel [uncultured Spirochaetota bacterium]HOI23477.1 sugar phosphate isomerase/epimerase family protein [Spirochaetales bacterium]